MIPYGRQSICEADIASVVEVLRSDFLTQGEMVPKFEKALAMMVHSKFTVAVNSATSALHLACQALGLGPGDRLWTTPVSFVASANCGLLCGAIVDFVDIDPETLNFCPAKFEEKLIAANAKGQLPKIIIPVHLSGHPCNMEKIASLAKRYGVRIVEDASHAIGSSYLNGEPVGSCQYADITVFSFHPVKIITTGEGGAATTNDPSLAAIMSDLRSHGITRDTDRLQLRDEGAWYYEQLSLGQNYRMTDLQAALGVSQLKKLDGFVKKRRQIATQYNILLEGVTVATQTILNPNCSSWHLYLINLTTKKRDERRQVFDAMRNADIGVNVHYIPIHLQPFYQSMGFKVGDFPNAERYYDSCLTLPLHPELKPTQQTYIIETLRDILSQRF